MDFAREATDMASRAGRAMSVVNAGVGAHLLKMPKADRQGRAKAWEIATARRGEISGPATGQHRWRDQISAGR
jgi:hypothetical protein